MFDVYISENGSIAQDKLDAELDNIDIRQWVLKKMNLTDEQQYLGSGGYGTVTVVSRDGVKYALKVSTTTGRTLNFIKRISPFTTLAAVLENFALREELAKNGHAPHILFDIAFINRAQKYVLYATCMELAKKSLLKALQAASNDFRTFENMVANTRLMLREHFKNGFLCTDLKLENIAVFEEDQVKLIDIDTEYCKEQTFVPKGKISKEWIFFLDTMFLVSFLRYYANYKNFFHYEQFQWFVAAIMPEYVEGSPEYNNLRDVHGQKVKTTPWDLLDHFERTLMIISEDPQVPEQLKHQISWLEYKPLTATQQNGWTVELRLLLSMVRTFAQNIKSGLRAREKRHQYHNLIIKASSSGVEEKLQKSLQTFFYDKRIKLSYEE